MVKRRYSNERDFLNSLGKTVREFYLNIFDFCDENGLKRKLETTGYSVKFVKYKGQYTPIFWMIGGGEVQDAETIILPYDMMTGFTDEQIANYKLGIWRLDFYIKNCPKRDKWLLSSSTSLDNVKDFLTVVESIISAS